MNHRGFVVASWVALVAWLAALAAALFVAGAGVASAAGWSDDWQHRLEVIPGTDLVTVEFTPGWSIVGGGQVCDPVVVDYYPPDCYGFILQNGEQRLDGMKVLPADIRAVGVEFAGRVVFDAEPGWRPLLLAMVAMTVVAILVVAFVLYQLWRILRSAAGGEPFAAGLVRRLRLMGGVLIAWEVVEPLAWLFLSPKAFDYRGVQYGPVPFDLGSMEPGGPNLVVIAFGALLVLLASVFRHGAALADEQRLTV